MWNFHLNFVDMGVDCTGNYFRKEAIEKTILRILRLSAFSHSLDPKRTFNLRGFRMPSATRNVNDNPCSRFSDADLRATIA